MAERSDVEVMAAKLMGNGRDGDAEAMALVLGGAGQGTPTHKTNKAPALTVVDADDDEDLDYIPSDAELIGEDEGDNDEPPEESADEADEEAPEQSGEYSDDDVLTVTVDGEQKEVTIRELKQRFSGEGAIEKRLQEATELRKAATTEREAAAHEIETHRANMLQTIQKLDQFLFMPMVLKPDPGLRQQNMQAYLMQKDAYEEDQSRIGQLRAAASNVFEQHRQDAAQLRAVNRDREARMLVEKAPELGNADAAKAFQSELMEAVRHYGISKEQLAEVDNHILFLMARDAGRYLKLQKARNSGKATGQLPNVGAKQARHLKPGAAVSASNVIGAKSAKVKQQATQQARKTGSVDDIASMLVANATVRRK